MQVKVQLRQRVGGGGIYENIYPPESTKEHNPDHFVFKMLKPVLYIIIVLVLVSVKRSWLEVLARQFRRDWGRMKQIPAFRRFFHSRSHPYKNIINFFSRNLEKFRFLLFLSSILKVYNVQRKIGLPIKDGISETTVGNLFSLFSYIHYFRQLSSHSSYI